MNDRNYFGRRQLREPNEIPHGSASDRRESSPLFSPPSSPPDGYGGGGTGDGGHVISTSSSASASAVFSSAAAAASSSVASPVPPASTPLPPSPGSDDDDNDDDNDDDDDDDDDVSRNTQNDASRSSSLLHLRCLFGALTCPLIPLAATACVVLLWMVVAASDAVALRAEHGDVDADGSFSGPGSCDEPLVFYSRLSLGILMYAPHHRTARRFLTGYRDGPDRPTSVRWYDNAFKLTCAVWIYLGVLWTTSSTTCHLTAPKLYASARLFVILQSTFVALVAAPVLCLPCVYVWMVRRGLAGDGGGTDGRDDPGAARRAEAILAGLEEMRHGKDGGVPPGECCICMTDFCEAADVVLAVDRGPPVKGPGGGPQSPSSAASDDASQAVTVAVSTFSTDEEEQGKGGDEGDAPPDAVVRTACGHVFHRDCLGLWLRSSTVCPLCREDLCPVSTRRARTSASRRAARRGTAPSEHGGNALPRTPSFASHADAVAWEQAAQDFYHGDDEDRPAAAGEEQGTAAGRGDSSGGDPPPPSPPPPLPPDVDARGLERFPYAPLLDLEEGGGHRRVS